MALITQRPKGTQDVVPAESYRWQAVEHIAAQTAQQFGFREIRIPTFEDTKLFVRSVGDTTDVVQKEMYTVSAKGGTYFTLRPEGTAGTLRAVIENGLIAEGLPQKVYYFVSCFRHEKPEAGRFREHHQFGCELIGSALPSADAELISMAGKVLDSLGIKNIELNINSIGCPECRAAYQKALRDFLRANLENLCPTCQSRFEKNPMRILDCKTESCAVITQGAPTILDYLCDDCQAHFDAVQENLTQMGIAFRINPKIVRGLDYYTRTVFEFVTTSIGSKITICAGGRYDGLIENLGGAPTPALGFGMGLERLILTMQNQGCAFPEPKTCDLYLIPMGTEAQKRCMTLITALRGEGYWVEYDLVGRGLKAQMKYADKIKAKYTMVIGDNELAQASAKIKNMATGEQSELTLNADFAERFSAIYMAELLGGVGSQAPNLKQ